MIPCVTFGHGACSNLLFTGGWDNVIRVWNVATGDCVKELKYHKERITDLCVSADGKLAMRLLLDMPRESFVCGHCIWRDISPSSRV